MFPEGTDFIKLPIKESLMNLDDKLQQTLSIQENNTSCPADIYRLGKDLLLLTGAGTGEGPTMFLRDILFFISNMIEQTKNSKNQKNLPALNSVLLGLFKLHGKPLYRVQTGQDAPRSYTVIDFRGCPDHDGNGYLIYIDLDEKYGTLYLVVENRSEALMYWYDNVDRAIGALLMLTGIRIKTGSEKEELFNSDKVNSILQAEVVNRTLPVLEKMMTTTRVSTT